MCKKIFFEWKTDEKKRKWAVTGVAALLLFLLYLVIFVFSGQDSEKSSSVSMEVTEKCVDIADKVTGSNWSKPVKQKKAEFLEHYVRKTAHFCEYACMGILVSGMWRPWKKRSWKLFLIVIVWVFVSASLDEFHQTFVSGRYGGISDVILDTCGGMFGYFVISAGERLFLRNKSEFKIFS